MDSIFTKIIKREIPAYILYEDDTVIAFLDIMQATRGHTLVITKTPYKNIFEVPEDELKHLIGIVKKLSIAIKLAFDVDGINILNNNGAASGQEVFHYHVHIIPRYALDGVSFKFPNHMGSLVADDYKKRAAMIIAALS